MGDEDLRRLEREVRGGAPRDVGRRWVLALERAELLDEAIDGLLAELDRDPASGEARRALGALPAWSGCYGPGGGSGVDVAGLRAAPAVRWRHPCDRPRDGETTIATPPLLGGWPGVVVLHRGWTEVVDPRTGARRWVTDWGAPATSTVDGHVLVLGRTDGYRAHDLWTGAPLGRAPGGPEVLGVFGGRVVTWTRAGPDTLRIEGRRWDYAGPPEADPCWSFEVPGAGVPPRFNRCGPRLALCGHGPEVALLEPEAGLVWTRPGSHAVGDDEGVIVQRGGRATCCAPDGTALWTADGTLPALGTRRALLDVPTRSGHAFTFVDRATGAVTGVVERGNAHRRRALARDVLYLFEPGALEAFSDDGAPLWRVPREALSPQGAVAILPLHRGLVAYFEDLSLVALGPA